MPRQFRLRSLFILTAIVAVGCAILHDVLWNWTLIPVYLVAGTCGIPILIFWLLAWFVWFITPDGPVATASTNDAPNRASPPASPPTD
jgi:protein-S-isoprenylcysteine O-methyltransferase Ste14